MPFHLAFGHEEMLLLALEQMRRAYKPLRAARSGLMPCQVLSGLQQRQSSMNSEREQKDKSGRNLDPVPPSEGLKVHLFGRSDRPGPTCRLPPKPRKSLLDCSLSENDKPLPALSLSHHTQSAHFGGRAGIQPHLLRVAAVSTIHPSTGSASFPFRHQVAANTTAFTCHDVEDEHRVGDDDGRYANGQGVMDEDENENHARKSRQVKCWVRKRSKWLVEPGEQLRHESSPRSGLKQKCKGGGRRGLLYSNWRTSRVGLHSACTSSALGHKTP
ncbi:hypothetical protein IWZ00DRAFT_487847 [Phyllosticta capitalensis]|uniref:uncharacterized protein n=1 Tax=Phyllosticta capitalensis TaxID=121624 RepID=UPI00313117B8